MTTAMTIIHACIDMCSLSCETCWRYSRPSSFMKNRIANERQQHPAAAFYSIGGQLMQKAQRGICIVKYSDGTVRKATSR